MVQWKSKEQRTCKDCGKRGVKERRRCKECVLIYNRERARKSDKRKREKLSTTSCSVCGKPVRLWRGTETKHRACGERKFKDSEVASFRKIARDKAEAMGFKIQGGLTVHHVDENPKNNDLSNLWVLHISAHSSLHGYLKRHRSLWLKNQSKHDENCWNTLRDHLTTAWLETTSAKVIKLGDIGQSAAEPLNEESHGEGSEAMHVDPKDN